MNIRQWLQPLDMSMQLMNFHDDAQLTASWLANTWWYIKTISAWCQPMQCAGYLENSYTKTVLFHQNILYMPLPLPPPRIPPRDGAPRDPPRPPPGMIRSVLNRMVLWRTKNTSLRCTAPWMMAKTSVTKGKWVTKNAHYLWVHQQNALLGRLSALPLHAFAPPSPRLGVSLVNGCTWSESPCIHSELMEQREWHVLCCLEYSTPWVSKIDPRPYLSGRRPGGWCSWNCHSLRGGRWKSLHSSVPQTIKVLWAISMGCVLFEHENWPEVCWHLCSATLVATAQVCCVSSFRWRCRTQGDTHHFWRKAQI